VFIFRYESWRETKTGCSCKNGVSSLSVCRSVVIRCIKCW